MSRVMAIANTPSLNASTRPVSFSTRSPSLLAPQPTRIGPGPPPAGDRLLVVNTPDNRLTIFDLTAGPPSAANRIAQIPVGLEPVSVAALSDSEAWVVNQISDDVSVVNLNTLHVRATLRVGDDPE